MTPPIVCHHASRLYDIYARFLHHNFVCALLNDLFGIQARAGCQCAGPYGIRLLTMLDRNVPKMKKQVVENDVGILKPGFCRLSLTFFISDAEASVLLSTALLSGGEY